jgi:hypothetical protein
MVLIIIDDVGAGGFMVGRHGCPGESGFSLEPQIPHVNNLDYDTKRLLRRALVDARVFQSRGACYRIASARSHSVDLICES